MEVLRKINKKNIVCLIESERNRKNSQKLKMKNYLNIFEEKHRKSYSEILSKKIDERSVFLKSSKRESLDEAQSYNILKMVGEISKKKYALGFKIENINNKKNKTLTKSLDKYLNN